MSKASERDAIVLVLDVGESVAQLYPGEKRSFYDKSRDCISLILQRKLFSANQDVVSLVVVGCNETDNSLNYKHVAKKFSFALSSWNMVKFIETVVVSTKQKTDWVQALVVAMDLLKNDLEFDHSAKKIVMFSDFSNAVTDENMFQVILRNLKSMDINLTVIGLDGFSRNEGEEPPLKKLKPSIQNLVNGYSDNRRAGQEMLHIMWKELGNQLSICNFMSAMMQLSAIPRKSKKVAAWNAVLDIGNIKILISSYKKTDKTKGLPPYRMVAGAGETDMNAPGPSTRDDTAAGGEAQEVVTDLVMHFKHEDPTTKEIQDVAVTMEDVIEGYRYGATIVPFTDADKEALAYKPGPKGLSIIGFAPIASVPPSMLTGDAVHVVTARDQENEEAFSALVQAMHSFKCLAVSRRVYNTDFGCRLGILYPLIEELDREDSVEYKECLLFINLAYHEDFRSVHLPSLSSATESVTTEQMAVVDRLIDEMDLMEAEIGLDGEPCEALDIGNLHEFMTQFHQYCIVQKVLYPEAPPPKQLPDHIKDFVTLPHSLVDVNKELGTLLAKTFTLTTKIEEGIAKLKTKPDVVAEPEKPDLNRKTFLLSHGDVPATQDSGIDSSFTDTVTDNSVASDLRRLFHGSKLPSVTDLWKVIETHVVDLCTDETEVWTCVKTRVKDSRTDYANSNPDDYNYFVIQLKRLASEKGRVGAKLWDLFVEDHLGLISEAESSKSSISQEEADSFLGDPVTQSPVVNSRFKKKQDFGATPAVLDASLQEEDEVMNILF